MVSGNNNPNISKIVHTVNKNNVNLRFTLSLKIKKGSFSDIMVSTQLNYLANTVRNIVPNYRKIRTANTNNYDFKINPLSQDKRGPLLKL